MERLSRRWQHTSIDELVFTNRNPAVVSMVTVMELLVHPLHRGPAAPYQHTLEFLSRFPYLSPVVIDFPMAQEAASLRATDNFRPADALIIATGLIAQVGHLVTNDVRWRQRLQPVRGRIQVCYLSDHL